MAKPVLIRLSFAGIWLYAVQTQCGWHAESAVPQVTVATHLDRIPHFVRK